MRLMQDETKKRKNSKAELLSDLQREARQNIFTLKKLRFTVYIEDNRPLDYKFRELTYGELYHFETFHVYSGDNLILCDISFFTLKRFTRVAKRVRRQYGVQKLHEHIIDLLDDFYNSYPNERVGDNYVAYQVLKSQKDKKITDN